jgi:hypothetical protein
MILHLAFSFAWLNKSLIEPVEAIINEGGTYQTKPFI